MYSVVCGDMYQSVAHHPLAVGSDTSPVGFKPFYGVEYVFFYVTLSGYHYSRG